MALTNFLLEFCLLGCLNAQYFCAVRCLVYVEIIKYCPESAMSAKGPFLDCRWSSEDKSVYNIYYPLIGNEHLPVLVSQVIVNQYVKIGHSLGWVEEASGAKIKVEATINGTVIAVNQILVANCLGSKVLIFSMRGCQHVPKDKNQGLPVGNKSILQTADICALCDEPLWYYYEKEQIPVTFRDLKKEFSNFDFEQFDWKVDLNEQFTRDTEIGGTCEESYRILCVGKVTYMFKFKSIEPSPSTIVLKYKKVVCKHELISSTICVFCLVDVRTLKNVNFRRYLFQFDQQNYQQDVVVSGKALEDRAVQFKNNMLKQKKALLVLDLDNTILHSISLKRVDSQMMQSISEYAVIPPEEACIFIERTLVKFRPGFEYFLSKMVDLFEIFIYTKGTRPYAEEICRVIRQNFSTILSTSKNFLPHRIISRDEDDNLMKKSLEYIIPNNKDFMLILDDRRDVWNHSPLCVFTRPYMFFYYVEITSDGKTKLEPVEWEKGGGTLEHKFSPQQQEKLKQFEHAEEIGNEKVAIEKYQQIKEEIEQEKLNDDKVVVCIQQPNQSEKVTFEPKEDLKNQSKQTSGLVETKKSQEVSNIYSPCEVQKKSEQPCSNNSVLKNNSNVPDEYLITTLFALKQAHIIYFQKLELDDDEQKKEGKFADLCFSFHEYKKTLLDHMSVLFIMRDYKKTSTYRRAQKLGLRIAEGPCEKIDVVVRPNNLNLTIGESSADLQQKNYASTVKKLKSVAQAKQIPIVSESWIDICYEYNCCVHYRHYEPEDPYARIIFGPEAELEKATGSATMEVAEKIKLILSAKTEPEPTESSK